MELKTCTCGNAPKYFGNDNWGYIECNNCHKRTSNFVDVDCRVEWAADNYGNQGFMKRYHKPNAPGFAAEAWNDMICSE